MKFFSTLLILFLCSKDIMSQDLSIFKNLVNKTWQAEGNWRDGSLFKQSIEFEFGLDSTIVKSKTYGFTDDNQQNFGLRNEGIRRVDTLNQCIQFWEFDIFGGLTTGNMIIKDNSFFYQYKYGITYITDHWDYIDENTYIFRVGVFKNGKWSQIFLETKFNSLKK